ncbi:MAG TPA: hypothetical protein VFV67_16095 [Actinophytocola sp.]|uniref:hypothetical protein n=1 Tax=Actinophytocola sp. TaxID=1872138 RepID=UPI002DB9D39B|nr:hypothetical protein [Actinophytocola sp.]HEU5472175.1 hypothetical protein [Actinophytocola sp.]
MLILGLLLVVASAAATALLVAYNGTGGTEQTVVLFGRELASVTALEAFVSGLVVAVVFCLGVWMMVRAGRRSAAVRSEYRAVRREARENAKERDRLADELAKERSVAERDAPTTVVETPPKPTPQERGRSIAERFRRQRQTDEATVADEQATRGR